MFDHVTIRASDRAASERFYRTVLPAIGTEQTSTGDTYAEWDDFSLARAEDPGRVTRRLHTTAQVARWLTGWPSGRRPA